MTSFNNLPAVLVLEDGTFFKGKAVGKIGTTTGEICFNTGTTGYQEVFTDPSYFGQIMVTTNSHIGSYGISEEDNESDKIQIAGLVCKNYNKVYSRKMAQKSIEDFFIDQNVVGICDVDTRALVRHIRQKGAMNAIISSENLDIEQLKTQLSAVPSMSGRELSSEVSTTQPYYYGDDGSSTRIAVLDLGVKKNILKNFEDRQVYAKVFPAHTTFEEMEKWNPDGYFISNGPGDPAALEYVVETVKNILNADKAMFGICLGHQVLGLANGIRTEKMLNGHRGINHPVRNILTGRCEMTSQNHGFSLVKEDLENHPEVEISHINLNDGTVEGIRLKNKKAFSVQYHPEASPGPHDSKYLFDDFIAMVKG